MDNDGLLSAAKAFVCEFKPSWWTWWEESHPLSSLSITGILPNNWAPWSSCMRKRANSCLLFVFFFPPSVTQPCDAAVQKGLVFWCEIKKRRWNSVLGQLNWALRFRCSYNSSSVTIIALWRILIKYPAFWSFTDHFWLSAIHRWRRGNHFRYKLYSLGNLTRIMSVEKIGLTVLCVFCPRTSTTQVQVRALGPVSSKTPRIPFGVWSCKCYWTQILSGG